MERDPFGFSTVTPQDGVYTETVGRRFSAAKLTAVRFFAATDGHDTPLTTATDYVYRGSLKPTAGHLFFLTCPADGQSTVYIVPTPDMILPSLSLDGGVLSITCGGYPVIRGVSAFGEEALLCRTWYRTLYRPHALVCMSNTWGERGGREVVTEEFVRREIDCAAQLLVDAVQVDDGWQKNAPTVYDEERRHIFPGEFWEVDEAAFPHGIEAITPYARERGVETGLWFAPHSANDFEYFERDLAILGRAHREWGFRYFKLDMMHLDTLSQCRRAEEFFGAIPALGEGVTVELDVTANRRLGYLASAPYGTLFVENRYSAWGNYYPHATLRSLWLLCRYIPASKFQFEVLNPCRFTEKYEKDDPYRPELYGIDYLFASVMVANPLLWMEMQRLQKREAARLHAILAVWRRYRGELAVADVTPIGEEPSGCALTGFMARHKTAMHLILLREGTERDTHIVPRPAGCGEGVLLASDTEVTVSSEGDTLHVRLKDPRSYAWILFPSEG